MDGVHTESLLVDDSADVNTLSVRLGEINNLVTSCITHTGSANLTGSIYLSTTGRIYANIFSGSVYSQHIYPQTIGRLMTIGSVNASALFYGSITLANTNNYDAFFNNQYTYSATSTMSTVFGETIKCTGAAYLYNQFQDLNGAISTTFYKYPINGRLISKVTFPNGLTASYAYLYASYLFGPLELHYLVLI